MLCHPGAGVQQQAFGNLHHDAAARQTQGFELLGPGYFVTAVIVELHGRLVNADLEIGAKPGTPLQHLLRGLLEHPFPNVHNQTTGLCNGNERRRADQAARGVLPADQHFGLAHGPGGQVDNGLVHHPELFVR